MPEMKEQFPALVTDAGAKNAGAIFDALNAASAVGELQQLR